MVTNRQIEIHLNSPPRIYMPSPCPQWPKYDREKGKQLHLGRGEGIYILWGLFILYPRPLPNREARRNIHFGMIDLLLEKFVPDP